MSDFLIMMAGMACSIVLLSGLMMLLEYVGL